MLPYFPSPAEEHPLMAFLQDLEQRKTGVRQDVLLDMSSGHKVSKARRRSCYVRLAVQHLRQGVRASAHRTPPHASMVFINEVPDIRDAAARGSVAYTDMNKTKT